MYTKCLLFIAHHKMAEGHIEFTLSARACVFSFVRLCVLESCTVRFNNYLAQMIIETRRCVACKNHVARSKVKVTVHTLTVCAWASCVQPITSSGMVGGQGHNWHFKFVRSRIVSDP